MQPPVRTAGIQTNKLTLNDLLPRRKATLRDALLPHASSTKKVETDAETSEVGLAAAQLLRAETVDTGIQAKPVMRSRATQADLTENAFWDLTHSTVLHSSYGAIDGDTGQPSSFLQVKAVHRLRTQVFVEEQDLAQGDIVVNHASPSDMQWLQANGLKRHVQQYLTHVTKRSDYATTAYLPTSYTTSSPRVLATETHR